MSTRFFTNHTGKSLLQKFKGAFEHIANIHAFHAIVGYFRASGYFAIREHLLKVPEVKILVGINVDKISSEAKKKGLMFFGGFSFRLIECLPECQAHDEISLQVQGLMVFSC